MATLLAPPSRLDWYPDWSGVPAVAIVAGGPSAKAANVKLLKGRTSVLAIKNAIDLVPFAECVYGCDAFWWRSRSGLPNYSGLKVSFDPSDASIRRILIERTTDRLLLGKPGWIGSGGNSGFQALNLAVCFGARRILLIGFDMHDRNGTHWFGRNQWPGQSNPTEINFRRWRKAFEFAATQTYGRGIDIINASATSEIVGFRKLSLEATLEAWGLRAAA